MLAILLLVGMQAQDEVVLPDTVVSGPRSERTITTSEAKVTVVTREELEATGERSLPRAIGVAAGVWIQETNLGGGAPVIRGLLGNQILIVVDGVRLNDSTTRFGPNQSLNTIDPAIVERVEIVRGARSLLYGSDAIGGAILIWTRRRPPAERDPAGPGSVFQGTLEGQYDSSVDGGRASASASGALDEHGLLLVGSFHDFDDLKSGDNEEVPFTAYHGHDLFGAYEWAVGEGKTLRATGRAHRDFDVPRTDRLVAGFGQTEPANEQWFYSLEDRRAYQLTYTEAEGDEWFDELQVRFALASYEEQRDIQGTGSSTLRVEQDEVDTVSLGTDLKKSLSEEHLLTWGFEVSNDDVDSYRNDTDLDTGEITAEPGAFAPESRYTSAGLFVQDEVFAFDPYFVTLGARYSFYDFSFQDSDTDAEEEGDFDAFVLSGEASREIAEDVYLTAGLGQGFRAPNLEDLANTSSFAGGTELGNPDLEPEQSLTAEVTAAARKPMWGGSLATFLTQIDDLIGRSLVSSGDPDMTGDEVYLRDNTGEASIYGIEAALDLKLFDPQSPYSVVTNAAWVRGREYGETADPLTGELEDYSVPYRRIPPLFGRVGVRYDGPYTRNYLDWAEVYVLWADDQEELHPFDETDPRIDPNGTPGWATWNVDLGGPITSQASWSLGFHNIFDKRYRVHASGIDAPGAAVVIGLRANF